VVLAFPAYSSTFTPYTAEEQLYSNGLLLFKNIFETVCIFVQDAFIYSRFVASSRNCCKISRACVMKICG